MAACLYDPEDGFFTSGPLRSVKGGDFLTSPEVSPWFGRMLARFVSSRLPRVAGETRRPEVGAEGASLLVVDVGAGSGSLLGPLIAEMAGLEPPVGAPGDEGPKGFSAVAVEVSPAARAALEGLVGPDAVLSSIEDLPEAFSGAVIANELLDNLPVSLAVNSEDGWKERWVGTSADGLGLVTVPARPEVVEWCDAFAGPVPDGGLVEVQIAASVWVEDLIRRLQPGVLIVIDYGGTAEELEPRRTQGTLRTYRNHHLGPQPLLEPGATDITVDVNFTAMAAAAVAAGATVSISRQDDFLVGLGLRELLGDLRRKELELARSGDATERLVVRSEITDAETLLHPRGLGDFRVMVAATTDRDAHLL